jgi:hypothetical protein
LSRCTFRKGKLQKRLGAIVLRAFRLLFELRFLGVAMGELALQVGKRLGIEITRTQTQSVIDDDLDPLHVRIMALIQERTSAFAFDYPCSAMSGS